MGYYYLYDSFLQEKLFTPTLAKLETTITDLGIQGRVGRLTLLKSMRDLVEAAVRDGAETVVAVGNDITLSLVSQALAKHPRVTLGFIPLGKDHQTTAPMLGIPVGILACHVLSARITQPITLAKANNQYFLQSATTQGTPELICDKGYQINLDRPHELKICNLDWLTDTLAPQLDSSQPNLRAVLTPIAPKGWWGGNSNGGRPTIIPFRELKVSSPLSDTLALTLDSHRTIKTPATITLAHETIRLIVGKKRLV